MEKREQSTWRLIFGSIWLVLLAIGMYTDAPAYLNQGAGVFRQLSWAGKAGLGIFVFVCLTGILAWMLTIFWPSQNKSSAKHHKSLWLMVATILGFGVTVIVFIYTSSLRIMLPTWFSVVYFAGLAVIIQKVAALNFKFNLPRVGLREAGLAAGIYLLIKALQEFKLAIPAETFWRAGYYGLLLFNLLLSVLLVLWLNKPANGYTVPGGWLDIRWHFRWVARTLAFVISLLAPWLMLWHDPRGIGLGISFRLEFVLIAGIISALLIETSRSKLLTVPALFAGISLSSFIFMSLGYLSRVNDSPFSQTYSEGNRLYDYSLIFGKNLYQYSGSLDPNYFAPGRYGLWGLPFVIPGLSIWVHRLWNALLYIVPGLILGWLVGRQLKDPFWQFSVAAGTAIFFNQGPVYPSLTIALIPLALTIRSRTPLRVIAIIIASLYAGLSRFTWVAAIAAWAGLLDLLLSYPNRKGKWMERLLPTAGMILAGLIPGALVSWLPLIWLKEDFAFSQPLLWYRLLPSATYPMGVLIGSIIATFGNLAFIIWMIKSGKWKLDYVQIAAICIVLTGFYVMGLVASAKIGGGSNLHNLDMYFACLILIQILGAERIENPDRKTGYNLPLLASLILSISFLVPVWTSVWGWDTIQSLSTKQNKTVLQTLQAELQTAQTSGDVLLMDQRQLLTFGYLTGIKLIPDYEKKLMMDHAMSADEAYFKQFSQDLQNHRFSMILSSRQRVKYQTSDEDFGEENNAWVNWAAKPILKYYTPYLEFKEIGITLYVPKP